MSSLATDRVKALEREIEEFEADFDGLQSQPRQLESALRERSLAFDTATASHSRQVELLTAISAGNVGGTLVIARAILADFRSAAGDPDTIPLGTAAPK